MAALAMGLRDLAKSDATPGGAGVTGSSSEVQSSRVLTDSPLSDNVASSCSLRTRILSRCLSAERQSRVRTPSQPRKSTRRGNSPSSSLAPYGRDHHGSAPAQEQRASQGNKLQEALDAHPAV